MSYIGLTLLAAFVIDYLLGEPKRFHPLVGFGNLASALEKRFNLPKKTHRSQMIYGMLSWLILILPLPLVYVIFSTDLPWFIGVLLECAVVYWALGHKSLRIHGLQIYSALKANDLSLAQKYCGYIVSRNTIELSEQDICRATTESMLENGHDAVIATLFWYVIGGAPMVIIHRLANTLDAMWGYRNQRYQYFGRFSARADDVLGYPSAFLTSILFAIQGAFRIGFWNILNLSKKQSLEYKSFNGGRVMSAGASLMKIKLGGKASYHGKTITSPPLGQGDSPTFKHISASLFHVLFAALIFIFSVIFLEIIMFILA